MLNENQIDYVKAHKVFNLICQVMKDNEIYANIKDENSLQVSYAIRVENMVVEFMMMVDAERQLIRHYARLPFVMDKTKRLEGAIATCLISNRLSDGQFNYNYLDGSICLRITQPFINSEISKKLVENMISASYYVVCHEWQKFYDINKGNLDIIDFIDQERTV